MMAKLSLVFLTVIHITVAFEFQSLGSPTFHPNQFNPPSTMDKEVKKAISDLKAQGSRLEKQEELISEQAGLLNKLGGHLDQQEKSLKDQYKQQKDQGKHIGRLDQLLSQMHASQQEEKSRLSNIEEKLQQMEAKVVTTGKPEAHPHGNLTNIENAGLSFALVTKTVKSSEMEHHCAELVEGGRLIVLDTKQKYEAMQDYLNKNMDEGKEFYIGLRRQHGVKTRHWSNGVEIDDNFWCSGPGHRHRLVCTVLKRHPRRIGYCIGGAPCHRGNIICEKPQQ